MGELIKYSLLLIIICIFTGGLTFLSMRKHPVYHEIDCKKRLIIYVWSVTRYGRGGYRDFVFIKEKSGKYHRKRSFYDWCFIFVDFLFIAILIFVLEKASTTIVSFPRELLPINVLLILGFFVLIMMMHESEIIARYYFEKNVKKRMNQKRK